ncbi:putative ATP-dependent RNA helicase DDX4 [Enteropsectra breve]|nr:putative ATP-dependent RNA helicase DDX4 [Enteropsectra breve]
MSGEYKSPFDLNKKYGGTSKRDAKPYATADKIEEQTASSTPKNKINPSEKITIEDEKIKVTTNSPFPPINDLKELKCARALGFSKPTIVQKYSIPIIKNEQDILVRAPTGMGKTLCFLLPAIENIKYSQTGVQICVVSPVRELCDQIKTQAELVCGTKQLYVEAVYGSMSSRFRPGKTPDVLIAAPGRLKDLLNSERISLSKCKYFILDEADKLLDMGFERDVLEIKSYVNKNAVVCLFSATYSPKLTNVINQVLPADRMVVEIQNETLPSIKQEFIEAADKKEQLLQVLSKMSFSVAWGGKSEKVIVFTETKNMSSRISAFLKDHKFSASAINGDLDQIQRNATLASFRSGDLNILVATSVAARGIDVKDVGLVINYDFPRDIKEYIHRIGRTGREGKEGKALSFIDGDLSYELKKDLEALLKELGLEVPSYLFDRKRRSSRDGRKGRSDDFSRKEKENNSINQNNGSQNDVERSLSSLSIKTELTENRNLAEENQDDDIFTDW